MSTSTHLKHNFTSGNTWMPVENGGVLLKDYEGPLMAGMVVMFQLKTRGCSGYGVQRWIMKINTMNPNDGAFTATIVESYELSQYDGDDSDCCSEEEMTVQIATSGMYNPQQADVLQVAYPLRRSGGGQQQQIYRRIMQDSSFTHHLQDG